MRTTVASEPTDRKQVIRDSLVVAKKDQENDVREIKRLTDERTAYHAKRATEDTEYDEANNAALKALRASRDKAAADIRAFEKALGIPAPPRDKKPKE